MSTKRKNPIESAIDRLREVVGGVLAKNEEFITTQGEEIKTYIDYDHENIQKLLNDLSRSPIIVEEYSNIYEKSEDELNKQMLLDRLVELGFVNKYKTATPNTFQYVINLQGIAIKEYDYKKWMEERFLPINTAKRNLKSLKWLLRIAIVLVILEIFDKLKILNIVINWLYGLFY